LVFIIDLDLQNCVKSGNTHPIPLTDWIQVFDVYLDNSIEFNNNKLYLYYIISSDIDNS